MRPLYRIRVLLGLTESHRGSLSRYWLHPTFMNIQKAIALIKSLVRTISIGQTILPLNVARALFRLLILIFFIDWISVAARYSSCFMAKFVIDRLNNRRSDNVISTSNQYKRMDTI